MAKIHPRGMDHGRPLIWRLWFLGSFALLLAAGITMQPDKHAIAQQNPNLVAACQEAVVNGSFEDSTSGNWTFGPTAAQGMIVDSPIHAGSNALRLGIPAGTTNGATHSTAYQTVTLPTGLQSATLTYWEQPSTSGDGGDYREVIALRSNLTILRTVNRTNGSGDNNWTQRSFDLTNLAGQNFILYFNVYNNGSGSPLVAYFDEISLQLCDNTVPPTATSTPTNTPLVTPPSPTATPLGTPAPVRVRAGTAHATADATTVTVPLDLVVLTDRVNIGVLSLELRYNAAYLKATACTVSGTMELLLCNVAEPGRIQLAGVSARGIRSEVNLASLTFEVLQAVDRTVPLTVQVDLTGNVDGAPVSTDGENGTVTLLCAPNTENCSGINLYLPLVNR